MAKTSTPKSIKFTCTANGCANKDIDYLWSDDSVSSAECGGCGVILEAIEVSE
jgi:Zn ribbon nucleic-acid-binding protein